MAIEITCLERLHAPPRIQVQFPAPAWQCTSIFNYPDLKANENFRDLQVQLEGTENRVTTARSRYTETVADYNSSIKKFPTVIYAGWFGFDAKPQFKADAGASQAPKVEF